MSSDWHALEAGVRGSVRISANASSDCHVNVCSGATVLWLEGRRITLLPLSANVFASELFTEWNSTGERSQSY